jgi:hypothetical protein
MASLLPCFTVAIIFGAEGLVTPKNIRLLTALVIDQKKV